MNNPRINSNSDVVLLKPFEKLRLKYNLGIQQKVTKEEN